MESIATHNCMGNFYGAVYIISYNSLAYHVLQLKESGLANPKLNVGNCLKISIIMD